MSEKDGINEILKDLAISISDVNGKIKTMSAEINGKVDTLTSDINGKFNVHYTELIHIKTELKGVKEQVTTANGRTKTLEMEMERMKLREVEHFLTCPHIEVIAKQSERIGTIEKKEFGRAAIVKFILIASTLAGTIGGLVFTVINSFNK